MNIFCKIFNWFKNLFSKKSDKATIEEPIETNEEKPVLLGGSYVPRPKFNIDLLISKLESYKDKKVFLSDIKKYDVKEGEEKYSGLSMDDRALKENLYLLLRVYNRNDDARYQKWIEKRIAYYHQWDEEYDDFYINELKEKGVLCPKCNKGEMKYHETGLADIEYDWFSGGPVGAGVHVSGHGHSEYQFHYKKCNKCGYYVITEYREVPSWFDDIISDLFDHQQPFKKGDLISDFKNMSGKKYTSHKILRW